MCKFNLCIIYIKCSIAYFYAYYIDDKIVVRPNILFRPTNNIYDECVIGSVIL